MTAVEVNDEQLVDGDRLAEEPLGEITPELTPIHLKAGWGVGGGEGGGVDSIRVDIIRVDIIRVDHKSGS